MTTRLDLQEFFVEGHNQKRSHVLLHITEPSTPQERKKGHFFAIVEIEHANREYIEQIQHIIEEVEASYYNSPTQVKSTEAFERIIEDINRRGHHLLRNPRMSMHCVLGIIQDTSVAFVYHGSPQALLFYHAKGSLHTLDILSDEPTSSSTQLFSALMEGAMNEDDFFYVSTPYVRETIPKKKLETVVSSRNVQGATEYIEHILQNLRSDRSHGGILFQLIGDEEPVSSSPVHKNKKEQKKEQAKDTSESNYRPRKKDTSSDSFLSTTLIMIGRTLFSFLGFLIRLVRTLLIILGKIFIRFFIIVTNKGNNRKAVINETKRDIISQKEKIVAMPLMTKILFVFVLIFIVVFLSSIFPLRAKEERATAEAQYNQQLERISAYQDEAEASLIYGDEEKALVMLQEAKKALTELPNESKEEASRYKTLEDSTNVLLQKLQKLVTITPSIVVNITETHESSNVTELARIGDSFIAYGKSDELIYTFDPDVQEVSTKTHANAQELIAATTPKEEDEIIFLTTNNAIASYDNDAGVFSARDISFLEENTDTNALFVYNQRLYSLDPTHNQVYKHNRTQTGYDRGTAWISSEVDLSKAVSFAIDGNIFVLTSTGDLHKFTAGEKESFTIKGLEPTLSAPTRIWTHNTTEYIYILEPAEKRLITLDKEGKLIQQYTATEWQAPSSFIIDEEKGIAYILDSGIVYRISL